MFDYKRFENNKSQLNIDTTPSQTNMSSDNKLSLQSSKPLSYVLTDSHLQDHLPYIDTDTTDLKSKVAYMIKIEQKESMENVNPYTYIQDLKLTPTPFINSQKFNKEVERVKNRINSTESLKKDKNKLRNVEIDKQKLSKGKLNLQALKQSSKEIKDSYVDYQQWQLKNLNLETHKQFSPCLLKQMIQSLQEQKSILKRKIQTEQQEIEQINRLRKYEQYEAREKEDVVEQRIKLMVNKRRKLQ